MEAKKNVRHSDMMERICEQLAQLPEEDIRPTIMHLLGVVSGVKIATETRKTA